MTGELNVISSECKCKCKCKYKRVRSCAHTQWLRVQQLNVDIFNSMHLLIHWLWLLSTMRKFILTKLHFECEFDLFLSRFDFKFKCFNCSSIGRILCAHVFAHDSVTERERERARQYLYVSECLRGLINKKETIHVDKLLANNLLKDSLLLLPLPLPLTWLTQQFAKDVCYAKIVFGMF